LTGAPNAGKSSLLNALSGEDRAIVSDEPGTTRDWLEQRIQVRGLTLLLYDTAGLRAASHAVESEGVRRAYALARDADVLALVLDRSKALEMDVLDVLRGASGDVVFVLNKNDLEAAWTVEALKERLRVLGLDFSGERFVGVSALTGEGLELLMERVVSVALRGSSTQVLESFVLTQLRHERAATEARDAMRRVLASLDAASGAELLALDLRSALDALGEIIGVTPRAQVVQEIFKRFCIGK
jgi:tRNA modification GTPase